MIFNLFKFEITSRFKGILGWSLGLLAFAGLYISVYPQIIEEMGGLPELAIYDMMGMEFGSFEGYMSSVVLGFLPILLGIYMVVLGTGLLAGEEDNGTLELLMAQGFSRPEIVSVKAVVLAVIPAVILVITAAGDALIFAAVKNGMNLDTPIEPFQFSLIVLSAWPFCFALGMIGLALGSITPGRRLASVLTGTILAVGYFGENLTGMVEKLKPLQPLSLFYYFDSSSAVFSEGVKPGDVLVLLSIAAVSYMVTLFCFGVRNVTTGSWVWKRGKIPS